MRETGKSLSDLEIIKGQSGDSSRAWDNVTIPDIQVCNSRKTIRELFKDFNLALYLCNFVTGLYLRRGQHNIKQDMYASNRFWTFDGKRHDIYSAGEFVLYRHKKKKCSGEFTSIVDSIMYYLLLVNVR